MEEFIRQVRCRANPSTRERVFRLMGMQGVPRHKISCFDNIVRGEIVGRGVDVWYHDTSYHGWNYFPNFGSAKLNRSAIKELIRDNIRKEKCISEAREKEKARRQWMLIYRYKGD